MQQQPPGGYPQQPPQQQQYQQPAQQPPQQQQQYQQPPQQQQQYQQPPQQQQQTPPYYPDNQTPPHLQEGNPQYSNTPAPGAPVFHAPDVGASAEALAQAEADAAARQQGNFSRTIKVPGPNGETNWTGVPINYTGHADIYLCGGWAEGVSIPFVEQASHFIKTPVHPKGILLKCSDDEHCLICQSRKMALADPALQQSANMWGRQRKTYLYNCFDLTNPSSHYGPDGVMKPFILDAGAQLQSDLKRLFDNKGGIVNFCHPQNGRPIRVTKKKTGAEARNVEWGALDLDPQPLDPYFFSGLSGLWDLTEEIKPSKPEKQMEVLSALGWPIPQAGGVPQQQTQSYNPNPVPPAANPYPQQQTMPYPPQQAPQQQAPAPMPAAPPQQGMPAAPPAGTVPGAPPPGPPQAPPPQQYAPPPQQAAPQPGGLPPGVPPPPAVTSTGQGVPPPPGGTPQGNPPPAPPF